MPTSIAVLPGTPSSIAVAVHGSGDGNPYGYSLGRGVFILDDGLPRANYIQPPEVAAEFLINGPPGYLLGMGDNNRLVVLRLGTVGATLETHGGLFGDYNLLPSLLYTGGAVYGNTGPVVDLTNPEAPLPAGRFVYGGTSCTLASRSATRIMMFCPGYAGSPNLSFLRQRQLRPDRLGHPAPRAAREPVGEARLPRRRRGGAGRDGRAAADRAGADDRGAAVEG